MTTGSEKETVGQSILRRFESHGFWAGLGLGLLAGVLISGPNFHDWTLGLSALVTAACVIGGGVIGFLAATIAAGSMAGGSGLGGGGIGSTGGGADGSDGGGGDA